MRVKVTVGGSTWSASVFPSTEQAAYVLPVKSRSGPAEGVVEGDELHVDLRLAGR